MPLPSDRERIEAAVKDSFRRPKEYEEDFGEKPKLLPLKKAKSIYKTIQNSEPMYKTAMAGIDGRMSRIINSREFRNALAGTELRDDWVEVEPGKYERESNLNPEQTKRRDYADNMINKLKWCLTGLTESARGVLPWEGVRQSAQFAELLKQNTPYGSSVLEAMKTAARQLEKEQPQRYEPKKKKDAEKNGMNELGEINTMPKDDLPDRRIDLDVSDGMILGEEPKKAPKENVLGDFYDDLYYLDRSLQFGLELPKRDPASVAKKPDLKKVKTWGAYLDAMYGSVPHDPEQKKDHLARVLVGAFQAGRVEANLRGRNQKVKPFSPSLAEDYVKQLKEEPVFKQICKDPNKVRELLKKDPREPHKQFNAMMNVFRPFGGVEPEKSKEVLRKLQGMLPYLDKDRGRSSEWKAMTKSLRTIDPDDPLMKPEEKLKEVFNATCGYMKGKKSLRDEEDQQNRFDQAMDVLAVLAETGDYAKMAAQSVVDRTNEVRLGHDADYKPIKLKAFGVSQLGAHSNAPKLRNHGLDPVPAYPEMLETMPQQLHNTAKPLSIAAEELEALYSPGKIELQDAVAGVATALALAKQQVYCFPDIKVKNRELKDKLKRGGRAVINGDEFDTDQMMFYSDPAVRKLAQKLLEPEARREFLRNGQLDRPPQQEEKKGRHVKWADKVIEQKYTKLSNREFESRIVRGGANLEPLAKKGEVHEMLKPDPKRERQIYYRKESPTVDNARLDIEKLQTAFAEAKREVALEKGAQPQQLIP